MAIITGENTAIVKRRAEKLRVDHLFQGVKDKLSVAQGLAESLGIMLAETAYIGDDIGDIALLKHVGYPAAPANAPDYVKQHVRMVTRLKGGEGAFREFVERMLAEHDLLDAALQKIISR